MSAGHPPAPDDAGGGIAERTTAGGTPLPGARSPLSDAEWHRLHPLTPLFRGGLALVVVAGIVIANLRDRVLAWLLPTLVPEGYEDYTGDFADDPIDFLVANDLILLGLLVVLGLVLVLIGLFYMSWRFHTFRITGDLVEVRSGVLFRTHRRAPLDRVQGVNITRPMFARLVGMAKLEVLGAGTDGNVKLEYLSTPNAEEVRADILRLASGRQLGSSRSDAAVAAGSRMSVAANLVGAGINEIIAGAEPEEEPQSVVHIPVGRLIGSHLLSGSTIGLLVAIGAIVVGAIVGTEWILFGMVPAVLGFGAYWFSRITKALRYSIAPTSSGVRVTFGLFTTVTETLPPGRIHAIQVSQPILWRPKGWWAVTVNRLSGRSMGESATDQFTTVLPVGKIADVERVLRLLMPSVPESDWPLVLQHGLLGPAEGDPYATTPRRARLLRLLSWRRNGFVLGPDAILLRKGLIWRKLAIFPYARLQSVGIDQGPIDRALSVANLRAHTIAGPVDGGLGIIDRDVAVHFLDRAEAAAIAAAATDRSHRWAGEEGGALLVSTDAGASATEAASRPSPGSEPAGGDDAREVERAAGAEPESTAAAAAQGDAREASPWTAAGAGDAAGLDTGVADAGGADRTEGGRGA